MTTLITNFLFLFRSLIARICGLFGNVNKTMIKTQQNHKHIIVVKIVSIDTKTAATNMLSSSFQSLMDNENITKSAIFQSVTNTREVGSARLCQSRPHFDFLAIHKSSPLIKTTHAFKQMSAKTI